MKRREREEQQQEDETCDISVYVLSQRLICEALCQYLSLENMAALASTCRTLDSCIQEVNPEYAHVRNTFRSPLTTTKSSKHHCLWITGRYALVELAWRLIHDCEDVACSDEHNIELVAQNADLKTILFVARHFHAKMSYVLRKYYGKLMLYFSRSQRAKKEDLQYLLDNDPLGLHFAYWNEVATYDLFINCFHIPSIPTYLLELLEKKYPNVDYAIILQKLFYKKNFKAAEKCLNHINNLTIMWRAVLRCFSLNSSPFDDDDGSNPRFYMLRLAKLMSENLRIVRSFRELCHFVERFLQ